MSEDTIKKCNFCRLADELNTEEILFGLKRTKIILLIQKWFLVILIIVLKMKI